jgi:uncharacterized repeat protein (TIGR01451 family)
MLPFLRRYVPTLLVCACLGLLGGCSTFNGNPSYFPYLWPTGEITRTHAKPPGKGNFANFDPHAVTLEVRPLESTDPVRSQRVVIATIYDENCKPRRDRRVEWMIEGVGNIVEVDESGFGPGRGYKVDNKYAVSYTSYGEHTITRGNANKNDDFTIRSGQTWCVISSPVEGDTHVTVYAPEIFDWDKHKVFVTHHWVDADWVFPRPVADRAGTEQTITTNIFRHTDRQPLANYRVRYKVIDGPPAIFLPSRSAEAIAVSNIDGNALARLVQVTPAYGVNRISVEIVRAPDPTLPSAAGVVVGRGETTVSWLAPAVTITKTAPAAVALGQDIAYTLTISNTGQVESKSQTVRDFIPDTLRFVSANPSPSQEGNQLIWTLGALPPGQQKVIQLVLRSTQLGTVNNRAQVVTEEGTRDEKTATTQITAPQLKLSMTGPATGVINAQFTQQITVSNPGTGPATGIVLSATFDAGLEHESKYNPVELPLGTLAAGETKTVPLVLTPRKTGQLGTRVSGKAAGNLTASAQNTITIQDARLGLSVEGRRAQYVDQPVIWDIRVSNPNDIPVNNVVVKDTLPSEVAFRGASQGATVSGNEVTWRVGPLQPREEKTLRVTTTAAKMTRETINLASASADPGLQAQSLAKIEIRGVPAMRLDVTDTSDPVEVGGKTSYRIVVQNQGTLPAADVKIEAQVPAQMKLVEAKGPSQFQATGRNVVFLPLQSLPAKQTVEYTIEVEALEPGDARFEARLTTLTLPEPIIAQEATNILPRGSVPPLTPVPATNAPSPPAVPAIPAPSTGGRLVPVPMQPR